MRNWFLLMQHWIVVLFLICWIVAPQIVRTVDGDTFDVTAPAWMNLVVVERVRVLDVDAWEMREEKGPAAREFTRDWLVAHSADLRLEACKRDSFGRVLATVYDTRTGEKLADALKAAGMAKPGKP